MGRRIVTTRLQANEGGPPDDYASKVVKYVPADIIAAWLGISALLAGGTRLVLLWVVFAVLLVVTPVWMLRVTRVPDLPHARVQAAVSTAAFAVWVFATGGGPFADAGWYDPAVGGVVLILFTLFSGLVNPDRVDGS